MNFSKKTKYLLFALLTILNIVFRLPVTTHERGVDSFFIHNLATSISTYGYAGWIIHPVSFTGLYPLSYASAVPFILSGMSQIMGISIEYMILFFCILLGVFSVFFSFLFAKEVKNDDLFAFLVAFVFSLSPIFLKFTIWDATTRSLFMAFLPLFLWALIKCWNSFSGKYIVIATVSLILLTCSHRICLFIPLIFVAFIAAVILTSMHQRVKQTALSNYKVLNGISFLIFPIAFLLLFFVQFLDIGFYNKLLPDFYTGFLIEGEDTYSVTLNIAANYFGKVGIILFFGLIGFIILSRTVFNEFGRLFVILSILTLTPFLVIEDYTPEVILPFFSILAGFGLINTYDILKQQRRIVFSILAICIVISTGFSWFMLDHWQVHTGGMSDKTYATSSFLKEKANGTSVANFGLLSCRISAFSGKACLPYGGAYAQPNSPEQLIYGSVKADEVVTRPLPLSKIISNRMLYVRINALSNAKNDWVGLMESFPWANKTKILCAKYDIHYVIEDVRNSGGYWHWNRYYSRLLVNFHETGNKVYDNNLENIWYFS
jgi:hypothetical protein